MTDSKKEVPTVEHVQGIEEIDISSIPSPLDDLTESEKSVWLGGYHTGRGDALSEIDSWFVPPELPQADEYETQSLQQMAAKLKELKSKLEEIGKMKTEIQKAYDFLSIDILPDRMDEEGIETLKIKGVGRLQAQADIRCSMPSGNSEALKKWLKEHGHGSMISDVVNASTLKAFVREMMKEEKEWPKDLLNVTPYSRATVIKA